MTEKFQEFSFYSEKINANDWENLFNHTFKSRIPFFDFLDLSKTLPLKKCKLIVKRHNKTIRFYIKYNEDVEGLAPLIFPLKLKSEKINLEKEKETLIPRGIFWVTKTNVLDFIMKENVKSIEIDISPLFGKTLCIGKVIDSKGKKKSIIINNPKKFLEIDMEKNPSFYLEVLHHPILKSVHIESEKPLFEKDGTTIGTNNFDYLKHSLITGMSGTGKSKFLGMYARSIIEKNEDVSIVIIDPHEELKDLLPNAKVVDFKQNYVEPLETGKENNPLTIQLITQLISSVIGSKNKYAERVIFYSINLLSEINQLNLFNIGLVLTDSAKRMEFVSQTRNAEIKRFFSTEFENINIHHFNDAILPTLNFIGQYELYMGGEKKKEDLSDLINENKVTILSFNPNYFGRPMIKFFAGAIIQQMYILAITKKIKKPTILMVDEFPVVETEVAKNILSETRKFNLYLSLSMQYLSQIDQSILNSILTNTYNIISFRVSREDAKYLGGVMDIKVEEYFRKNWSAKQIDDEKQNLFTYLSPRECIVRLYGKDGQFMMPMKVKTVEMSKWI